ncbi:hypothetical protein P8935_21795 [Telmatobacter sp. DSM 110680]|uniref:Uncharacterized protein n=1 Tax=Telmatobacter sp. DSM 110680 TaxID=3036704 RepID=A0AAU7DIH3_9BACT
MINDVESDVSKTKEAASHVEPYDPASRGWLKVGTIAAASAVLGGLAAAWFYRKTLSRLREAENEIPDSKTGTTEDRMGEDF